MSVHTIVALFSGISAFTNHPFITFAAPRASLRCIGFVSTVLLVSFVLGYWLAALSSSESLVLPVRFSTCFLSSRVTTTLLLTNARSFFPSLFVSPVVFPLHPAKGFAFQAPEYILFTLPIVVSL